MLQYFSMQIQPEWGNGLRGLLTSWLEAMYKSKWFILFSEKNIRKLLLVQKD